MALLPTNTREAPDALSDWTLPEGGRPLGRPESRGYAEKIRNLLNWKFRVGDFSDGNGKGDFSEGIFMKAEFLTVEERRSFRVNKWAIF